MSIYVRQSDKRFKYTRLLRLNKIQITINK